MSEQNEILPVKPTKPGKKRFYKRVWFWVLVVAVIAICIPLANSRNTTPADSTHSPVENSAAKNNNTTGSDKTISQDEEFRKNFDSIKVGDLMKSGEGGSTESDVEKLLGKPFSSSTSDFQGVKTQINMWSKGSVSITVQFTDSKTVSKNITGFKFSRQPKLDINAYNTISDGSSYNDVVAKYGEPDGLNEMLVSGQRTVTAYWFTGAKSGSAVLTFTNGRLTSKSQSNLE
uniref:DUF3862 domain-containing protein n=1 Tax=uncultured Scardovia sp. TaxID=655654 RepID=UPI00374E632E